MNNLLISIDPGATSGVAVLTIEAQPKLRYCGHFKMESNVFIDCIRELCEIFTVTKAVIEDQYLNKNVNTVKKLSRIVGRWQESLIREGLEPIEIYPQTWQSKELGTTKATRTVRKKIAQDKAQHLFGRILTQDESDASLLGRYAAIEEFYGRLK